MDKIKALEEIKIQLCLLKELLEILKNNDAINEIKGKTSIISTFEKEIKKIKPSIQFIIQLSNEQEAPVC